MTETKRQNRSINRADLIISVLLLFFLLLLIAGIFLLKPAGFDLRAITIQALRYYLKQLIIAFRIAGRMTSITQVAAGLLLTALLSGLYFLFGVFQARRRPDEDGELPSPPINS